MTPTSTLGDISTSTNFSSRAWNTANTATMTDFGDCARVNLGWDDGAWLYFICDTKAEAVAELASLGFKK